MKQNRRHLATMAFITALALFPSNSAGIVPGPKDGTGGAIGYVRDINQQGHFKIEERFVTYGKVSSDIFRLWGVQPAIGVLTELVAGKRISCIEHGYTHMQHQAPISIVRCRFNPSVEGFEYESINQYLIETGQGTEICVESFNKYGTCPTE